MPPDELDDGVRAEYLGYFLVRTAATREALRSGSSRPAIGRYDGDVVERIMTSRRDSRSIPTSIPFERPGRSSSPAATTPLVGIGARSALSSTCTPRATFVIVADAGHALRCTSGRNSIALGDRRPGWTASSRPHGRADPARRARLGSVIAFFIRALIFLVSAALGLIAADLILAGFHIDWSDWWGFVLAI